MAPPEPLNTLEVIMRLIGQPASRTAFKADPPGAVGKAGGDPKAVPPKLIPTLAAMSDQELDTIARVNKALFAAGFETPGSSMLSQQV
jgi:hypothetical protein